MSKLHSIKILSVAIALSVIAGCASSVKTVPFKVQSDPLGAYVLFQVQADQQDEQNYDWIYLGNTPLDIRRTVASRDLKRADAFVIRVMKEGYLDQRKAWTGEQIVREAKKKGAVFWNPRLIPVSN